MGDLFIKGVLMPVVTTIALSSSFISQNKTEEVSFKNNHNSTEFTDIEISIDEAPVYLNQIVNNEHIISSNKSFKEGNYKNSTWRGVTLTWNNEVATLSGTATGGFYCSFNIYENKFALPKGISAGNNYNILINSTSENICLQTFFCINGEWTDCFYSYSNEQVYVPLDATGMLFRVFVENGKDSSGSFSFDIVGNSNNDNNEEKPQETGETSQTDIDMQNENTANVIDNNYLAPTGTDEDVTQKISKILSENKVCRLGTGDYYIKNLDMPLNSSIIGSGASTRIHLKGSDSEAYTLKLNDYCLIRDVCLIGASSTPTKSETIGDRHGILFSGDTTYQNSPKKCTVSGCTIYNFSGGGITCRSTGYNYSNCVTVSDCYIYNCGAGINIPYWSEFNKFNNIQCNMCYYGVVNNGGNNMFDNCDFSGNKLGCLMDNSRGQSPNNTHGSMVGCLFNHEDNNNGTAIKIIGCKNGYIFTACQFFYSEINISDSDGIVISDSDFGSSNCDISIKGGGVVLFANNMHQTAPSDKTWQVNISNNSKVHFRDCYVRSTGESIY